MDNLLKPLTHDSKTGGPVLSAGTNADSDLVGALLTQLGVPPSNHSNLIVLRQVDKRDGGGLDCSPILTTLCIQWQGGRDSRLTTLSDTKISSVEPQ